MKALLFISSLLIFVSCDNITFNPNLNTKIELSFEGQIYKYVLVDSTGYYAARDLEGIGNFKTGKTTISIIKDLEVETKSKVKKIYDQIEENYWFDGSKIHQLLPNPTESYKNPSKVSYCPEVKIFKIETVTISDVTLNDIYLTFYRDTLIELKCDENEEIAKAMEYKYGKGTYINETVNKDWNGENGVEAEIILWHNKKIKAEIHKSRALRKGGGIDYYFRITNKSAIYDSSVSCDTINERRYINKIKDEEKSKMKNF